MPQLPPHMAALPDKQVHYGHQGGDCLLTPTFTQPPLFCVINEDSFGTSETKSESIYKIWTI